jgi:hypothetical protein
MAAQSAGTWPSAEDGLMGVDPWSSQFHMEMVWWHLAHYGLWGRWPMAERALGCYQRFLPVARQLAGQFGYTGAKWGKQVGPEGRTAPWEGSFVLHWQQPHPIFFAELEYRVRPTPATLEKWKDIVFATADYMADFPTADETGVFHLKPVMPPSEQGVTRDTVFDLAYWRWGLGQAQRWRERLGLARESRWDQVRLHLAPLPTADGVFVHSAEWADTHTKRAWEHPDPIGVLGMLPPMDGVDRETAHRTVLKVWQTWDWTRCWGWDFPWMAMAAARVGEPRIAVEALLKDAGSKNRYDERGVNTGGPCPYLPGNGGLLYAVAMMAAGWNGGPAKPAPGFPDDGSREVAVVTRILGAAVRADGEGGLLATLQPGETIAVVSAVLSDLDAPAFTEAARQLVAALQPGDWVALSARHRQWWADFWSRSFIEIPDQEIEKRWYAALYVLGSCSRAGKVAPGLWGNWITTDHPNWHGDFHLNYNFEAPYYIAYSANHADLALPFYQAIGQSVPSGTAGKESISPSASAPGDCSPRIPTGTGASARMRPLRR